MRQNDRVISIIVDWQFFDKYSWSKFLVLSCSTLLHESGKVQFRTRLALIDTPTPR